MMNLIKSVSNCSNVNPANSAQERKLKMKLKSDTIVQLITIGLISRLLEITTWGLFPRALSLGLLC